MFGIIRQNQTIMIISRFYVGYFLRAAICILALQWTPMALGQEILLPLHTNPAKSNQVENNFSGLLKDVPGYLQLPFWDDFSHPGPYPDPLMWADNYVFINQSFGVHPKTTGVATFDALDMHGQFYDHIRADNTPYSADKLSSRPIRLDSLLIGDMRALTPADSVMISFYYQPQGKAGSPARQDSLVLEFYHPGYFDAELQQEIPPHWRSVWHAEGESLSSFSKDTFPYFRRVIIAIEDPAYFHSDFRFRFVNYVSYPHSPSPISNLSGMRSVWNIDYVYLDKGRSKVNTTYYDIAFASSAEPLLKRYTSMPWMHYLSNPQAQLRERFRLRITNLDNRSYNYTYRYLIKDEEDRVLRTYSGGSWVITPFSEEGYQNYSPHANPIVIQNPLPLVPADERTFNIVHAISEGATGDRFTRNDTIIYSQIFSDYFAYDDGTAERINLLKGWDPVRAHSFISEKPDELVAVQLYFLPTIEGQDEIAFHLVVYSSLEPETILYRSEIPHYTRFEEDRDAFSSYELDEAVFVNGPFYVGIQQSGDIRSRANAIGIGQDMSMHTSPQLFINSGDGWKTSVAEGALMLRAIMKQDISTFSEDKVQREKELIIYPNPANGSRIFINTPEGRLSDDARIHIFDMRGVTVYAGGPSTEIDISGWPAGVYVVRVHDSQHTSYPLQRLVIAR